MRKILFGIAILILIGLAFSRLSIIVLSGGVLSGGRGTKNTVPLVGKSVAQTFRAPSGLASFSFKINTFGFADVGILTLEIKESVNGKTLRKVVRSDRRYPPGEEVMFSFEPMKAGQYVAYISAAEPGDKYPTAVMTLDDAYEGGSCIIDGRRTAGDLLFKTYRQRSFYSFLELAATRLSRDWFKFIPSPVYFLLFAGYFVLASLFIAEVINLGWKEIKD